jgi:hypothetical protein
MGLKIMQKGLAFRREESVTTRVSAFALPGFLRRQLRCQCGASVMTGPGAVITKRRIAMGDIEMEMQIRILRVPRAGRSYEYCHKAAIRSLAVLIT